MPVVFAEVKAILDQAVSDWQDKNGRPPNLKGVHGDTFSFESADALKAAQAFGIPLIQHDVIKATPPRGAEANLIKVLQVGLPDDDVPRMPLGGPYRTDGEIQVIIDWINDGCLQVAPPPAPPAGGDAPLIV